MFRLDNNFLIELGLGALPAEEKNKMLAHIYETLEMRVGMKLAEQMSDAQLNEFESFIDRNDEGGALNWLESNFPNYKQVVADELEKLKNEIKQVAPQIMAQAVQAAQAQPTAQPAVQQPSYPQPQQQTQMQQPVQPVQPPQPQPMPAPGVGSDQAPNQPMPGQTPAPNPYLNPQASYPPQQPLQGNSAPVQTSQPEDDNQTRPDYPQAA